MNWKKGAKVIGVVKKSDSPMKNDSGSLEGVMREIIVGFYWAPHGLVNSEYIWDRHASVMDFSMTIRTWT